MSADLKQVVSFRYLPYNSIDPSPSVKFSLFTALKTPVQNSEDFSFNNALYWNE